MGLNGVHTTAFIYFARSLVLHVHSFLWLVGARGTEQHYFYFKVIFFLIVVGSFSASIEARSASQKHEILFSLTTTPKWKKFGWMDFQKTEQFCPHTRLSHTADLASHTQTDEHHRHRSVVYNIDFHVLNRMSFFVSLVGFRVARHVSLLSQKLCDPLISMKHTTDKKRRLNWIPYDVGMDVLHYGNNGQDRETESENDSRCPWWNETGSLVFIDWWPCMHWGTPTPRPSWRGCCCCCSACCRFFSTQPELISLNIAKRRGAEGGKKNPQNVFFFFRIPIHITLGSSETELGCVHETSNIFKWNCCWFLAFKGGTLRWWCFHVSLRRTRVTHVRCKRSTSQ